MTNPNDPAFPFVHIDEMKGPILDQLAQSRGLTKREYFAAMAMQGILSNNDTTEAITVLAERREMTPSKLTALVALEYADDLIAELK